jgi:hypothetical protein
LGADWIYNHSLVGLNIKTREFSMTKNGQHIVTFSHDSIPSKNVLICPKKMCKLIKHKVVTTMFVLSSSPQSENITPLTSKHPEISSLLQEYDDVFQEPRDLPPQRPVDHFITLVDAAKPVN